MSLYLIKVQKVMEEDLVEKYNMERFYFLAGR